MKIKEGALKVKEFVSENWKGIVVGSCVVVLGAGTIRCCRRYMMGKNVVEVPSPEDWKLGTMKWFKDPTGSVVAISNVPRGELASLGENLAKLDIEEKFNNVAVVAAFVEPNNVTKT